MLPNYEFRFRDLSVIRLDPIVDYPSRFHKQVEIGFITEGEARLSVEEETYRLQKGDLYLAFPNGVQSLFASPAKAIVFIAEAELFPSLSRKLSHSKPKTPVLRKNKIPPTMEAMFHRLAALAEIHPDSHPELFSGYANAILGEVLLGAELEERSGDDDLLQSMMLFLLDHYTRDISLDEMAKAVGYSKWYLSKVISSTFRCNFRTLVNSYRVSMAQNLLLSTRNSVNSIAYECGFKNQSSFNRVFLEISGVTPSIFRQQKGPLVQKPEISYR